MNRITNVLIFKDGFYWLTILANVSRIYPESEQLYSIVEKDAFGFYGINRNGFEFASDAYAYIVSLQSKQGPEYNDREEEKLKEMGEVE